MKSKMKKIAAILTVMLMIIQIVPALGSAVYSSGMIVGSSEGYKEALDIVASKGTYVLVGQTLALDVNEDYAPEWTSGNEGIATIDGNGVVTAIAEGTVTMTATVRQPQMQTATVEITVIDPEPLKDETQQTGQDAPSGEKKTMVIVINGENTRITYDGQEHVLDSFVATSNEDGFDAGKIRIAGEMSVKATNCGFYELKLEDVQFSYDDPNVNARFVVNNSFLKITPASVTVTPNDASKYEGDKDPVLTATVTGLFGTDTVAYTLKREEGETAGIYEIEADGEETQGNYRVSFATGEFTIESSENVYDLYNIAQIGNTYYRLGKTKIRTEKVLAKNLGKYLDAKDYEMVPYDFTDLIITINGKEYVYDCPENAEKIRAGGKYYTATFDNLNAVKQKIGAMNGSTPRWLVPEDQRYNDPNATDSFHANYTITLHEDPYEQDLFNMLKVGKSDNYYRLRKTRIIARDPMEYKNAAILSADEYTLVPDKEYDFTNTVLVIDGETYVYSEEVPQGEYVSCFTVRFENMVRQDRINGNAAWYDNDAGWLDGAKEQYGEQTNSVVAYHRNYIATLYKGNIVTCRIELHIDDEVTVLQGIKGRVPGLTVPEKEGFTFTGWQDGNGTDYDAGAVLNGDIVLYARWAAAEEPAENGEEGLSIVISSDFPVGQKVYAGTRITLYAELIGFENKNYTLQWQYSTDRTNWTDVEGANGLTYTYVIDDSNANYTWRIVANDITDK